VLLAAFSRLNCCESNVWARCYWYILLYYLITASIHGTAPQQLSCWTIMAAPLDTINVSKRLSNQDQNKEFYELTNKRMLRSVCRVKRTRVHDIEASVQKIIAQKSKAFGCILMQRNSITWNSVTRVESITDIPHQARIRLRIEDWDWRLKDWILIN